MDLLLTVTDMVDVSEDDPIDTLSAKIYPHQTVKQELEFDAHGNGCGNFTFVNIEESPIQELKQEIEPNSNANPPQSNISSEPSILQTVDKFGQCEHCDKCFDTEGDLISHQKIHTGEKPYQCKYCDNSFAKKCHLSGHYTTRHRVRMCKHCNKCFANESDLLSHQMIHTEKKTYQCRYCEICFYLVDHLILHQQTHHKEFQNTHTEKESYQCDHCGNLFCGDDLIIHQRKIAGEMPYKCSHCNRGFKNKINMALHQKTHAEEKVYKCMSCNKSFSQRADLLKHNKIHKVNTCQCKCCNKWFATKGDLVSHEKEHIGDELYQCSNCDKCFVHKDHLVVHQRTHTEERSYQCNHCDKSFNSGIDLSEHPCTTFSSKLAPNHMKPTGEMPYRCSHCSIEFTKKRQLVLHQRKHTNEKHGKIQIKINRLKAMKEARENKADKTADKNQRGLSDNPLDGTPAEAVADAAALVEQVSDIPDKQYQCSHCGIGFKYKEHVLQHERAHTKENPYHCKYCDKTYFSEGQLVLHEKTHTGNLAYICGHCNKSFAHKTGLISHQRIHTGPKKHPKAVVKAPVGRRFFDSKAAVSVDLNTS